MGKPIIVTNHFYSQKILKNIIKLRKICNIIIADTALEVFLFHE